MCNCVSCQAKAKMQKVLDRVAASGNPPLESDFAEMETYVRQMTESIHEKAFKIANIIAFSKLTKFSLN